MLQLEIGAVVLHNLRADLARLEVAGWVGHQLLNCADAEEGFCGFGEVDEGDAGRVFVVFELLQVEGLQRLGVHNAHAGSPATNGGSQIPNLRLGEVYNLFS